MSKDKIFAIKDDRVDIFEIIEGKLIKINEIMEKNVLSVKEDIYKEIYYIYKDSENVIYDFKFKKIKENIIKEKFSFLMASQNEGLYKDEKDNKYIIDFSFKNYSINPVNLAGEVIFFEGKKFFWIFENSTFLKMYKDLKKELTINVLKDINNFLDKGGSEKVKKIKIKDFLIREVYDYLYLVADVYLESNYKKQYTLIYYYSEGTYKLCNIQSTNEWKSIKSKIKKFYNIAFLSKNDIIFLREKYYSCQFLEDINIEKLKKEKRVTQ